MQAVSRMAHAYGVNPLGMAQSRMSHRLTATYQLPLQALCQPLGMALYISMRRAIISRNASDTTACSHTL